MRFLRTNTATRVTVGPFFDQTDGITPETALTVTSEKLTLVVDDGGVPTLVLDTAPTASGGSNDMVHITGDDAGLYDLELAAANVNYVGRAILSLTNASAHVPVFMEFMILPAMIYDSLILGTDRLDVNVTHAVDTAWASGAIGAATLAADAITAAKIADGAIDAATFAAGAINAAAIAADAITDAKVASDVTIASVTGAVGSVTGAVGSVTGNVGGNVVGSVASVAGAVGSVTGNVGGNVTGSVGSVATGGITAASIAADAIGASELATDAIAEIVAAIFARAFSSAYGSKTFDELMKGIAASCLGKVSGAATTSMAIRNLADNADVVTATVDASGNRTSVTFTP